MSLRSKSISLDILNTYNVLTAYIEEIKIKLTERSLFFCGFMPTTHINAILNIINGH